MMTPQMMMTMQTKGPSVGGGVGISSFSCENPLALTTTQKPKAQLPHLFYIDHILSSSKSSVQNNNSGTFYFLLIFYKIH